MYFLLKKNFMYLRYLCWSIYSSCIFTKLYLILISYWHNLITHVKKKNSRASAGRIKGLCKFPLFVFHDFHPFSKQ